MKTKILFLLTIILIPTVCIGQKCKPSKTSTLTSGEAVSYYGGRIRSGGFGGNDKSIYSLFITQVDDGKKGTVAIATLYEPVNNKSDYDNAVNNFLNENNLKTSVLEIVLNGEKIKILATECTQRPAKLLGDIVAYTVTFQGNILKSEIEKLQQYDLQKFRLEIGGHPYERYFKKPNKRTSKLKQEFSCVNMDNVFELKKKDASEMDLSEVSSVNYATAINGKWVLQGSTGNITEFENGKLIISNMGVKTNEGTYKIAGTRVIMSTNEGNSISEISMFLKDMLILKEKASENTYERIE